MVQSEDRVKTHRGDEWLAEASGETNLADMFEPSSL